MSEWFSRLSVHPAGHLLTSRSTRLHALLLGLQGLLNLVWAVIPDGIQWPARLGEYAPLFWDIPGRLFNLVFGIALVIMAGGLRRRKLYAGWTAFGLYLLAAGLRFSLASTTNLPTLWLSALLAAFLAGWLLLARRVYVARSVWPAVRGGFAVWLALLFSVLLVGAVGLGRLDLENTAQYPPIQGALRALSMFVLFYDPWIAGGFDLIPWLSNTIYIASAFAWGYLLWMLELPLPAPAAASPDERRQARQIVQTHGRTSQAHLTLLEDKLYYFTPGGSMVAYAVSGRVAVTLADPIGPAGDAPNAIRGFIQLCTVNDWLPAFCLTSGEFLDAYRWAGFQMMCMGHEGIIDLHNFTLKGNQAKTIRKRYNRLSAQGYGVEIYEPPISDDILRELRGISDQWLGMASAAEKRFFLAWFDEDYLRSERVGLVRGPDGGICAFTNLVPEYQLNEISIDLMRRHPEVSSGTMDFLFVSLFLWARDQGYDTFNLGLSPLFGVGEAPDSPLLERAIHYLYYHGNFYDFKGLNGFKTKFRPAWTPQYMVYPGLLSLGWVGLAMARVNAGENESLLDYFRSRPKHTRADEAEELALIPETNGD